jgi:hypothetical protein
MLTGMSTGLPRTRDSILQRHLTLARVAVVVVVLGIILISSSRMLRRPPAYGDFGVYLHAARLMTSGENIYLTPTRPGDLSYIYPPLFAFLMIPLTWIPVNAAIVLWTLFSVVLVGWIIKAFTELLSGCPFSQLSLETRWTIATLSILLTSRYILHHLDRGQANILELALAVAGITLLERADPKPVLAGITLGFSIVVKLITLPLTLWYVLRNSRSAAGIGIGVAAGALIPAVYLGWHRNLALLQYWVANYLLDTARQNANLSLGYNFSVLAQLRRFFTPEVAVEYGNRSYYLTIFEVPGDWLNVADWLIRAGLLAVVLVYLLRFRKSSAVIFHGGTALVFALTPLFFPTAQKNYFVFLLPAYIYVVWLWRQVNLRDGAFLAFVIGSVVFGSLTGPEIWGQFLGDLFAASGCVILANLFLVAAIFRASQCLRNILLKPS